MHASRLTRPRRLLAALAATVLLVLAACGDDDDAADANDTGPDGRPVLVATTSILGDVATALVGDHFTVITIMGPGTDPHEFQASAQEVATIQDADALLVNGGGVEEGLADVVATASADGVPTFAALDAVDVLGTDDEDHDEDDDHEDHEDHGDEDHDDEDHGDEGHDGDHGDEGHGDGDHEADDHDGHEHGPEDPHFFTDPARMAVAADALVDFLANVDGVDADALRADATAYIDTLTELDAEVEATLSAIPDDRRQMVLNHDVFAYFADRYDFDIVGSVLGSVSTSGSASPSDLAALADEIDDAGITAVFADAASADDLIETLADEAGADVEVVALYSESLGDADSGAATYVDMIRTTAERIAAALG